MKSVLTIGYGRNVFDEHNSERKRLAECARVVSALHMIVFSLRKHQCVPVRAGSLFLEPTNSRSRVRMVFDAYSIGSALLCSRYATNDAQQNAKGNDWIISAQDPFEAGLVGYLLHLRYGIPLQVQEHGDFFGGAWWRKEQWLNQVRYLFGKWLLRRADCVRVVSKRVEGHLVAVGVDPARITTLAIASEVTVFTKKDAVSNTRDLHSQYPDAVILAVGRLVKEKNLASLIGAFKKVLLRNPKVQLVIVGSGPEEENLKQLAKQYALSTRVSFIPWTDDVASYMRSADIFTLCSYREGWGRVIIEAMASGLPSVVTDVGCVGEVFIHKRHGIVVPVDDTDVLAGALQKLIENPELRRSFGETASRDIAAFTSQQMPYPQAWLATLEACGNSGKRA